MPRESFVYDRSQGKVVSANEFYLKEEKSNKRSTLPSPQVMRDIKPFRNVAVDGEVITSRSRKREMMKENSLVEIGTERPKPRLLTPPKKAVRAAMKKSLQQLGAL